MVMRLREFLWRISNREICWYGIPIRSIAHLETPWADAEPPSQSIGPPMPSAFMMFPASRVIEPQNQLKDCQLRATSSRWCEPGRRPRVRVGSEEVSENGLENHNTADRRTLDGLRCPAGVRYLVRTLLFKLFNS